MPCDVDVLKQVPLFANLDSEEIAILASQVEVKTFAARERIYKMGTPGQTAYVMVSGSVRVTTVDEDNQEVVLEEPGAGDFFGFASMLEETPHQTDAMADTDATCIEVDRSDIFVLIQRRPHAAMDMLGVLGRHFHAAQQIIRSRSMRHPNDVIEEQETSGERIADVVASFGGSWTFITIFAAVLIVYSTANVTLGRHAWDPYPFILLNLFLSMLAAIQAPIIMMSQNRQDKKDRLRADLDYEVNRRAHGEIQGLAHKLNVVADRLGDIEDMLRGKAH
jgi:uncharacterized membrane protein